MNEKGGSGRKITKEGESVWIVCAVVRGGETSHHRNAKCTSHSSQEMTNILGERHFCVEQQTKRFSFLIGPGS